MKRASHSSDAKHSSNLERFHVVPSTVSTQSEDGQAQETQLSHVSEPNNVSRSSDERPGLLKRLCTPAWVVLFSEKTQRTVVKSLLILFASSSILVASMAAYGIFYSRLVPTITHLEPIWFQYSANAAPFGIVDLTRGGLVTAPLSHEQRYSVSVRLHMPASDINFNLGNFMVSVDMQTKDGSLAIRSSRPAILRYQSNAQRMLRVFAKAIPLLVGLTEESQVITIPLVENLVEQKTRSISKIVVSLSDSRIQVYDAQLSVVASLSGIRYFMYHHRIATAIVFMISFASIEFFVSLFACRLFGQKLWHKLRREPDTKQDEKQVDNVNKSEEFSNSDEPKSRPPSSVEESVIYDAL